MPPPVFLSPVDRTGGAVAWATSRNAELSGSVASGAAPAQPVAPVAPVGALDAVGRGGTGTIVCPSPAARHSQGRFGPGPY